MGRARSESGLTHRSERPSRRGATAFAVCRANARPGDATCYARGTAPPEEQMAMALLATLVDRIERSVAHLDAARTHDALAAHLRTLRLRDPDGRWVANELEARASFLLPGDVDGTELGAFARRVADGVQQNPYLVHAIDAMAAAALPARTDMFHSEVDNVLADVATWALALDRLTAAMHEDWRVLAACRDAWKAARAREPLRRHASAFERAKVASLDVAFGYTLAFHQGRPIPPRYARWMLPLNIVEAILDDVRKGHADNARSALPLVAAAPGTRRHDAATGAGPTGWSDDQRAILYRMPLPRQWADLYGTWNLAFVAGFPDMAYLIPKLIIPQVAQYQSTPEAYIYKRSLALYAAAHFVLFRRLDRASDVVTSDVRWVEAELLRRWGAANLESARSYTSDLLACGSTAPRRLLARIV